ncbi:hypothetical protein DLAC_04659 [Tieghemostelium lacteum]|uniref:Uncharacterized protein n=1 Tax=Tieghemostelium lacteum TaxID=361077 RepID=A0A151ZK38_TIELA|nr:hypothetical protein DLAC_04659 [Tieghemostelium lacteum]|eukprot:KYQ94361.1 hypothetical protein DLAC_04659 [Tieghemostelium lacteum]
MFRYSLNRFYCSIRKAGPKANLNQAALKRLKEKESIEKQRQEIKETKKNRVIDDPIIRRAYEELEAEGYFIDKPNPLKS